MKSKQETFNTAYQGLRSQGFKQSFSEELDDCAYRGPDGLKCAAGWCISDEDYSDDLEGRCVGFLYDRVPSLSEHSLTILRKLQRAHDNAADSLDMQDRLHGVANVHNLTIPTGE